MSPLLRALPATRVAAAPLALALALTACQSAGGTSDVPGGNDGGATGATGPGTLPNEWRLIATGATGLPSGFHADAHARGFTEHVVKVIDDDGGLWFASQTLTGAGYQLRGQPLPQLLADASANFMLITANIEALAQHTSSLRPGPEGDTLDDDELAAVLQDLRSLGVARVAAGSFPPRLDELLRRKAKMLGIAWVHLWDEPTSQADAFVSTDLALYPRSEAEATTLTEAVIPVGQRLGVQSLVFGHGRTAGIPVTAGAGAGAGPDMPVGIEKNLLRYRAIDSLPKHWALWPGSPDALAADTALDVGAFLDAEVRPYTGTREVRPLCNLVVLRNSKQRESDAEPLELDRYYTSMFETAVAAISMAGYDLRVTYDRLFDNSDAYYVLAPADKLDAEGQAVDLPQVVSALLGGAKPVVVQSAGLLPATGTGWERLREVVGLDAAATIRQVEPSAVPETATIAGQSVRVRGFDLLTGRFHAFGTEAAPVGDLVRTAAGSRTSLVTVNFVHLEAAWAIAAALRPEATPAVDEPFFGYVSMGEQRYVAFAVDADTFVFEPPTSAARLRVRVFGSDGAQKKDETIARTSPLSVALGARELAVVEPR